MNDAIAVAHQATHFKILTTLSPVGLFCVIIILILIINFIIVRQRYNILRKMQILRYFIGFNAVSLRSYNWSSRKKNIVLNAI